MYTFLYLMFHDFPTLLHFSCKFQTVIPIDRRIRIGSVSTQLFDRALLNRNGVMDIWNMAHVEDGEKYYIRKEYTEVSELHKGSEQPVIIQQVPQQTEPAAGEEPQNGQEEKEGVNNAS